MIKLKTLDDVYEYIQNELKCSCKDIRIEFVDHECDTDRGTQRWTECELRNAPEIIYLSFNFDYINNEVDLMESIITAINGFKFYIDKTIYDVTAQLSAIKMHQRNLVEIQIELHYNP